MRTSTSIIILFAASIAFGQDLSKPVTLSIPATGVAKVVAKLKELTGYELHAAMNVAREPVAILVENRPLKEVMDRLAYAIGGSWTQSGERWTLGRSQMEIDEQRREFLADRQAKIKSALAELSKITPGLSTLSPDSVRTQAEADSRAQAEFMEALRSGREGRPAFQVPKTPTYAALQNMVLNLSPAELAALPNGRREVFALTPTRMQKRLPAAASNFLKNYSALHDAYVQGSQDANPATLNDYIIFNGNQMSGKLNGQVGECHLIANIGASSMTFTLRIFDASGKLCGESFYNLNLPNDSTRPSLQTPQNETAFELSEEAKQFAALMRYTPSGGGDNIRIVRGGPIGGSTSRSVTMAFTAAAAPSGTAMPKPTFGNDWRSKLLNPLEHDPLSFTASEMFMRSAKAMSKSLVMHLGDESVALTAARAAEACRPTDVLRFAESSLNATVRAEADWIVVRPRLLHVARQERVERSAASSMLGAVARSGALSLDAAATFVLTLNGRLPSNTYVDRYVGLIHGPSRRTLNSVAGPEFDATYTYALLTPMQRRAIAEGNALPVASASPQLRNAIERLVFDSGFGFNVSSPDDNQGVRERQVFSTVPMMGRPGEAEVLLEERTEYLASGIPGQARLTLGFQSEDVVLATADGQEEGSIFNAEELAIWRNINAEGGPRMISNAPLAQYSRFKSGKRTQVELGVLVDQLARGSWMLNDFQVEQNRNPVAFEQLPASFQRAVDEAMRSMRAGPARPPQ